LTDGLDRLELLLQVRSHPPSPKDNLRVLLGGGHDLVAAAPDESRPLAIVLEVAKSELHCEEHGEALLAAREHHLRLPPISKPETMPIGRATLLSEVQDAAPLHRTSPRQGD